MPVCSYGQKLITSGVNQLWLWFWICPKRRNKTFAIILAYGYAAAIPAKTNVLAIFACFYKIHVRNRCYFGPIYIVSALIEALVGAGVNNIISYTYRKYCFVF